MRPYTGARARLALRARRRSVGGRTTNRRCPMAQSALTPSGSRPQGQSLPQQIARMDLDRLRGYTELLAFYQGEQWPRGLRRRERRLTFNYAKAFIEKTAS